MYAVYIGIILLFVLLAIPFFMGKGAFLIAGYNTMSPEEQEKIDAPALCRFMAKILLGLAFSVLLWLLSSVFSLGWLMTAGIFLLIGVIVFALIYANTGHRFEKKGDN